MLATTLAVLGLLACCVALAWPWLPAARRARLRAAAQAGRDRMRLSLARSRKRWHARRDTQRAERGAREAIERARRAARDTTPADPGQTPGKVSNLQSARERRDAQKRRH